MEIQEASENHLSRTNRFCQHSKKLIECVIKMDLAEAKAEAKMDFIDLVGDLMPEGKPTYLDVIKYPLVKSWVAELGKKTMLKVLYLLVKDFCRSVNVVRNMNEDQMIEVAAVL